MKTGFNNYYFPDIQIVHFKGKSTSRDTYKDILHFYKAMRVYIRKRAAEGKYSSILILVIPGVFFREGLALLNRFLRLTFSR